MTKIMFAQGEKYYTFDPSALVYMLVNAVQEQQELIEEQQQKIQEQGGRIEELERWLLGR